MVVNRRGFLGGLIATLAAPAIIRTPGLLMPVKPIEWLQVAGPFRYLGLPDLKVEGQPIELLYMVDWAYQMNSNGTWYAPTRVPLRRPRLFAA